MSPKVILSLLLSALLSSAYAALDLTPIPSDIDNGSGGTYRELTFKCDDGKVTFAPPHGWTFAGANARAQLTPPDKNFAEGVIETAPLTAPQPLDAAAMAVFKEQVIATLPMGSQGVETISEIENGLMPEGNPSFEVMLSYKLMGKTFLRSALLVHGPRNRLCFRLTAQKEDFGTLSLPFRRSIMSWRFVETKPPEPGGSPAAGEAPPSPAPDAG